MSPYKRFSITLAAALVASTALVTLTLSFLVQRWFISDTAALTRRTVQSHFREVFGLDLSGSRVQAVQPDAGDQTGGPRPTRRDLLAEYNESIRLHFDLYDIVHTVIYRTDGSIAFSYRTGEIGTRLSDGATTFAMAMEDWPDEVVDWPTPRGALPVLKQYFPLHENGEIVGAVEIYRNLAPVLAQVRRIQAIMAALVCLIFAGLYIGLRQIYIGSTQELTRQSEALSRALAELNTTYDTTLQALSAALDSRDSETEGHAVRVTAYTARLVEELGLSPEERTELLRGALLHDVGKIGVPDSVLRKPGPLNEAEWQSMRNHPEIGYQMLREIPFLSGALPVVRHHHERFDGTGYPHRLTGEQIPLGARVFSVIDTFDAITSDRPYRRARSYSEARAELRRYAGTQFDPVVVEAFLTVPEQDWAALRQESGRPDRRAPVLPGAAALSAMGAN